MYPLVLLNDRYRAVMYLLICLEESQENNGWLQCVFLRMEWMYGLVGGYLSRDYAECWSVKWISFTWVYNQEITMNRKGDWDEPVTAAQISDKIGALPCTCMGRSIHLMGTLITETPQNWPLKTPQKLPNDSTLTNEPTAAVPSSQHSDHRTPLQKFPVDSTLNSPQKLPVDSIVTTKPTPEVPVDH